MGNPYLCIFCAFFYRRKGHVINRILHSWSFNMKFMKLLDNFWSPEACKILKITQLVS